MPTDGAFSSLNTSKQNSRARSNTNNHCHLFKFPLKCQHQDNGKNYYTQFGAKQNIYSINHCKLFAVNSVK